MKLWEIFRFEISQQSRRISTWLYFAAVLGFTYMMGTEEYADNARNGGYFLSSPFVIASVATIGSMIGLLITASLAGDAGARDAQSRMHPLLYTTPTGSPSGLSSPPSATCGRGMTSQGPNGSRSKRLWAPTRARSPSRPGGCAASGRRKAGAGISTL